jgi:hypothetical protein
MSSITVRVDFHLRVDEGPTLALLRDIVTGDVPVQDQRVVATDGEVSRWAIVTAVDVMDGTMLLAVHWDEPVNPP